MSQEQCLRLHSFTDSVLGVRWKGAETPEAFFRWSENFRHGRQKSPQRKTSNEQQSSKQDGDRPAFSNLTGRRVLIPDSSTVVSHRFMLILSVLWYVVVSIVTTQSLGLDMRHRVKKERYLLFKESPVLRSKQSHYHPPPRYFIP